jgi:hypothetical protein
MTHYTAIMREDGLLELPQAARNLIRPGQAIDIELPEAPKPNEKVLAMLRELEERKKNTAESDPTDTDEIIRQGRAGAIYGG